MPSPHEAFWQNQSFAFVGHSAKSAFPKLSYGATKKLGRTAYPVDPSADTIEGDKAYPDLQSLPTTVDAVVIEVPKAETAGWVKAAAAAGVKDVWIHMNRDTPEAIAAAEEAGINLCTGTCAVQYVDGSFPHNVHKVLRKLLGRW